MGERPGGGRVEDHERLVGVLDAACETGRGAVVVVDGEPGIGKTTLLEDVRRRAAPRLVVLSGAVDRAGVGRPFGPLLDALDTSASGAPDEIAAAFRDLGRGEPVEFEPGHV